MSGAVHKKFDGLASKLCAAAFLYAGGYTESSRTQVPKPVLNLYQRNFSTRTGISMLFKDLIITAGDMLTHPVWEKLEVDVNELEWESFMAAPDWTKHPLPAPFRPSASAYTTWVSPRPARITGEAPPSPSSPPHFVDADTHLATTPSTDENLASLMETLPESPCRTPRDPALNHRDSIDWATDLYFDQVPPHLAIKLQTRNHQVLGKPRTGRAT